ncbi:MAG: replicative DNA helicase [bacterium]|nr:replicative DNA helicase [bacterium]
MVNKSSIKIPPSSIEAEQSVLGSLLIDKDAIIRVADVLNPEDFYQSSHEKIYEAILDLFDKGKPVDILSVTNLLKERGFLKEVGGSSYLAEITNQVPTASHVQNYAKIVKEKKILRDLIRASSDITETVFGQGTEDIEAVLDSVEQKILSISQKSLPQNFVHVKDELKTAYERIEKLHRGEGAIRGVPTGFKDLDNILSGLQRSDFIVLGARPSLGKTALALDIARHAAMKAGVPVGYFSLEMSREQVIDRLISSESQVPLWRLRTGRITDDQEFEMIQYALDKLSRSPIYIDDTPSPNIMQMRSMARRLQIEKGLGLLVVDYLQLIMPRSGGSDNMVQQVTEISRSLKALGRELNVPILALSQLSRGVEQREIKLPKLSDLRESGSIEQDSDVVMFIYRKDRDRIDLPLEEQNIAKIIIAKHRNGPLGSVDLKFDAERVSFRTVEKRYEEATAPA